MDVPWVPVHFEPTGRQSEVVERGGPTHCPACGRVLDRTNLVRSYKPCTCLEGQTHGHRTFHCLACQATAFDPPHEGMLYERRKG